MAVITSMGTTLNMQNGLLRSQLPMQVDTFDPLISYSDTNILVEYGNSDDGSSITFNGSFVYGSEDWATVLVSGMITGYEETNWSHDYSTVPETYYSSGFAVTDISVTVADYRSMTAAAFAAHALRGADHITGSARADYLTGMAGDDRLYGEIGNDTLIGGTGADQMYGGAGNDLYDVDHASDQVIELAGGGIDSINASISFDLRSTPHVEHLRVTGSGDLNLRGNALDNTLTGNSGANIFIGGAGIDTASFASASGAVRASLVTNKATGAGPDFMIGIENLTGSRFADRLTGDGKANLLDGGSGNDTLAGGGGRDRLKGGAGADVFDFNSIRDSGITAQTRDVILDFGKGRDKIDLRDIDAITGGADNAFELIGRMGTAKSAVGTGKIGWYQIDNPGTANDRTILRLNNDRDAQIEMTIELAGLHVMKAGMFIL